MPFSTCGASVFECYTQCLGLNCGDMILSKLIDAVIVG